MKVTELLQVAEEVITSRDKTHCGSFDLCIIDGKINCIRTSCLRPEFLFIVSLSQADCSQGVTNTKWDRIWRGLFNAHCEGKII